VEPGRTGLFDADRAEALPWGNRGFINTLYVIAQTKADIDIKERVFNDDFEGLVVYVDKVPIQGRKMQGVLIYDEREQGKSNTIFSTEGYLFNDPKSQEVILRLVQGEIHRFEAKTETYHRIQFDTYDLKLELAKTFEAIGKKLREHEMSIDEIEARQSEISKVAVDELCDNCDAESLCVPRKESPVKLAARV
jgi:lipopolysaccharide export system permease protein